jgi:hypothetical protein
VLRGTPVVRRIPESPLAPGHRRIVFQWEYHERVFSGKGQGVARIAPPDSVRIDLFLQNGASGGYVVAIGDSLRGPEGLDTRRFFPPAPMLWAALGRITMTAADTAVRLDGDTLRADIGHDPTWRVTFGRERPVRIERLMHNRIEESVERIDSTRVVYRQARAGRVLALTVTARYPESTFDATIWRP